MNVDHNQHTNQTTLISNRKSKNEEERKYYGPKSVHVDTHWHLYDDNNHNNRIRNRSKMNNETNSQMKSIDRVELNTDESIENGDEPTNEWNDRSINLIRYNQTNPFEVRFVAIFILDAELPYTLDLAKPSIDIAIEKARNQFPLIRWEEVIIRNGSNKCTANLAGVFAAEEFYRRRVSLFIGPSCGLALDPVARMAAHWHIPVISSGGPHVQFQNKEIFTTLTRLSFSLNNLGTFIRKLFQLFEWKHVSMIVQDKSSSPLIPLVKETVVDSFENTEQLLDHVSVELHEISRRLQKVNLRSLLMDCAKESRVILIISSSETLRHILLQAYDLGMGHGAYAFLGIETYKPYETLNTIDWIGNDPRSVDLRQMYESLMLLSIRMPTTPLYEQFVHNVLRRSRTENSNGIQFSPKDVNIILAGFHDSVLMYGQAVTETIENGGNPRDGVQVTNRMWNRSYTNYVSGDFFINENGDKTTDYVLLDWDPFYGRMRPIVIYSGYVDDIVWDNITEIHWPSGGRKPNSDVTVCDEWSKNDLYCSNLESKFPYVDVLLASGAIILTVLLVILFFYGRKLRQESELTSLWWKIRWNEIMFISGNTPADRLLDPLSPNNKPIYAGFDSTGTGLVAAVAPMPSESSKIPVEPNLGSGGGGSGSEIGSSSADNKPLSAPQSRAGHNRTQFESSQSCSKSNNSETNSASGRGKSHIRINDYFVALPTYLQHLGNRTGVRAGSVSLNKMQQSCKVTDGDGSSSSSSSTRPSGPIGSCFPETMIGSVGLGNMFSTEQQHHHQQQQQQQPQQLTNKHISRESLVPIPNKGIYKGSKVFIKHLNIKHLTVNRENLIELKQLKDLAHENLIRFVGICADDQHISILTEYCEKGNLRDLLDNEGIRIDWPFRYSLINDIVEGMLFIHESTLNMHGALKSTNCVIDSRLVVKLTDFGLKTLRNLSKQNSGPVQYKSLLWTAPEHLRQRKPELHGSPKGDVYSFAIVLQEIITRSGPFETVKVVGGDGKFSVVSLDPQFIIQQLKLGGCTPYRPNVDQNECLPELTELLTQCWDEVPANRPSFQSIKSTIGKIAKEFIGGYGGGGNSFLENLLLRLEQYANDLEILVEQKTSAFFEEKHKCEELLYELLPRTVANQLKRGLQVKPESFSCVTIFFSDIVKFTQIASVSTPIETVDFLNDLYTLFDSIISSYDVYKVETVGDAYLVVSGLPVRNGNEHARQIGRMSLELLYRIKQFKIKHLPENEVKVRVGIHSGPCAAGVIGLKMPRYCLFGDTVNVASRMESHGEANKIHISDTTKHILDKFGTFHITMRGDIYLKGKGVVRTYWLESESSNFLHHYRFMERNSKIDQMYEQQIRQQSVEMINPIGTALTTDCVDQQYPLISTIGGGELVMENKTIESTNQIAKSPSINAKHVPPPLAKSAST
ncbi:hypothetical protein RDWZM_010507 [Blomia tropicalis]|uniref:Guanylate cyclase n=1 Tax=Blomia tropicalis TaxID=40697 RepID=A0A9Q0LZB6_BLOTA|nr:hypothetical protein RDWZM_010507 [Blomia tropicalis]